MLRNRNHFPPPPPGSLAGSGPNAGEKSDTSPAVSGAVIRKLLAFTAALIILPLITYFATVNSLFAGNGTKAGSFAALMANFVLFAYVAVVIRDDLAEQADGDEKKKKDGGKEDRKKDQ
jgi:vacuolar ATPase assembly integral membrane protein VMA21